jgi:hypothetical protein
MIEPEINHDLFELAPAQCRPQNPRLGRLADDEGCALLLGPDIGERRLDTADRPQRAVKLAQLDRVETDRRKLGQAKPQFDRLSNLRRIELLGDVALDPNHLHVIEIIDGRAKGKPVQYVENLQVRIGRTRWNWR